MIRNEFQSTLFRSRTEMLDAIASEWLSAGGANSEDDQRQFLNEMTDTEMAAEAIDGWGLDQGSQFSWDDTPSHMEFNEYTLDDLASAFARLRGTY